MFQLYCLLVVVASDYLITTGASQETSGQTNSRKPTFVLLHENGRLDLRCELPWPDLKVTWLKDHQTAVEVPNRVSIVKNDSTSVLSVIRANESDVGDYWCSQSDSSDKKQWSQLFVVRAKPRVKFNFTVMMKSESVVIGEDWQLVCKFLSAQHARNATMQMVRCDDKLQSESANDVNQICSFDRLEELNKWTAKWIDQIHHRAMLRTEPSENGTMIRFILHRSRYIDRGYFACVGQSTIDSSNLTWTNVTLLLRVKDSQIKSVWPSLLLVAMGCYLFALAGIFEGRRILNATLLKIDWDWDLDG